MELLLLLLCAVGGYLLGAISFARIVTRIVAPGRKLESVVLDVPGGDVMASNAVSATAVRLQLGPKYGCLTSLLDMLKIVTPMLALKLAYPGQPYYLVAAGMGTIGHVWPIYFGFRGGRGQSPILAGLFVLDPLGTVVTAVAAPLLGRFVFRELLVINSGGFLLMIPWVWWRGHGLPALIYVVAMNVVFWVARTAELRQYVRLRREGKLRNLEDALAMMDMGRGMGRLGQWLGLSKPRRPLDS
jgi:glycerol-3-phosphate acyltransferase PlsY